MTRTTIRVGATGLFVLSAAGAVPAFKAQALPRYAARYEQNCALCHVNPTGGGMRNGYATRELAPRELAWTPGSSRLAQVIDPQLSKSLSIGADFRENYVTSSDPAQRLDFFQMQGDIYLAFQLDSTATLYFDRGLSGTYELFGLYYPWPWLYAKAGRFTPSYGWKFDDHTRFVRRNLGFEPPANSDVGLEVGAARGPFDLQLALVNGNLGALLSDDRRLAGAANVLYRLRVGPAALGAGASAWHQPGATANLDMGGLRGSLNWSALTWMGEADWVRRDPSSGGTLTGMVTSHEITWALRQGLDLQLTYDFNDPDVDLESGATARYGAGIYVMPKSYVTLQALFRTTRVEAGPAVTAGDFDEAVVQLHLFY